MKITIFKSITNTDTPHEVTPQSIIKRIKEEKDIDLVHAIRGEQSKRTKSDRCPNWPASDHALLAQLSLHGRVYR